MINDSARAYLGEIPDDCMHEPYMSMDELRGEKEDGVDFWLYEDDSGAVGVMGIQDVTDVTLIRHAYVRQEYRGRGIGGKLLGKLMGLTRRPVLVGTWRDAGWAIRFYEKHGFRRVPDGQSIRLQQRYWKTPPRQVEVSIVLADPLWFERQP